MREKKGEGEQSMSQTETLLVSLYILCAGAAGEGDQGDGGEVNRYGTKAHLAITALRKKGFRRRTSK